MKVLVVGAGMYVTGKNGTGPGTLLSSLAETSKKLSIEEVVVLSKNSSSGKTVKESIGRINREIGSNLKVSHRVVTGKIRNDIKSLRNEFSFDCAIISVPDHLHYSYSKELLKSGIHCLVVKPLTPSIEEAKDLVAMQSKHNLYGAVEFHKRFDETNLYVKKTIDEKTLGKLLYFTVDYSQKITIPTVIFKGWAEKSNIFQYLGVHYVDLIYFLTGFLPVRAMAVGTDGILKQKGINTFDSIHATVIWNNPENNRDWIVSQFSTNWIDPTTTSAMSDQKYKIVGTNGRIECDQKNRGVELVHEKLGIQQVNPYFSIFLPDENGEMRFGGYGYKSVQIFINDIKDLKNKKTNIAHLEGIRPTFRNSLVSTSVIYAVNKSLVNNNSWEDISDIIQR